MKLLSPKFKEKSGNLPGPITLDFIKKDILVLAGVAQLVRASCCAPEG